MADDFGDLPNLGVYPVPPPGGKDSFQPLGPAQDSFQQLGDAQDSFQPMGESSEDDELQTIFDAAKAQPAGFADVLEMSQKSGLPPALVRENLDALRKKIEASEFDARRFKLENPGLARLMLGQPQLAPAIAQDGAFAKLERVIAGMPFTPATPIAQMIIDWAKTGEHPFKGTTSIPSGVAKAWQSGRLQVELSKIAQRQYAGTATPDDLKRGDEIDKEVAALGKEEAFGFLAGMIPAAAEQLPRYVAQADQISYYVSVGGAAGGVAGLGALGVGAVPGAIGGAGIGLATGIFKVSGTDEGALFYRDAIKDGAEPEAARRGAQIVAVANGLLEALPIDKVLRLVPGAKSLVTGPTKDIMRQLIKNKSVVAALTRAAGRAGEGMTLEGLTEALQEVSKIYKLRRVQGDGVAASIAEVWRQRQQVVESGKKGVQAAGGMAAASPGVWIETGTEVVEGVRAKNRQDFFTALGETISSSPTFKKLPEVTKTYVKALQSRYGIVKEVSLPAGPLREVLADVDVARDLPDVARQLRDAGPDTEVVITTADLAAHVAGLSGFEKLTPDIRVGENPTAREAEQVREEAKKIEAEEPKEGPADPKTDPGRFVFESVRNDLIKLGQTPEVASHNAALWQAFVMSRAIRLKKDPVAYFEGLKVSFAAGEFGDLSKREQARALTQPISAVKVEALPVGGLTFSSPDNTTIRLHAEEEAGRLSIALLASGVDELNPASLAGIGGRGWATAMYLKALAHAKEKGLGVASDSFRSAATERMYARLKELGAPFELKEGRFQLSPEAVQALDLDRIERENEARAEIQALRGEKPSVLRIADAELLQKSGDTVRGFFQTNAARDFFKITLTGKANLSTFIHESGHAFLAILERDSRSDPQSAADLQVVREWLGSKGEVRWTKDQLETFARGFEAYLWEGKAPSTRLGEVFAAVKGWLRYIYTALTRLDVEMNDEIRGVMDRLLATDMEIEKAKQITGLVPPEDTAGLMTPEQYAAYKAAFEAATEEARERADRATLAEFKRALSDEYAALRTEVEKVGKLDPTLNIRMMIDEGRMLDGSEVPAAFKGKKLDREWVKENAPSLYPLVRELTEDGGEDPGVVATVLGAGLYTSGLDLIEALSKAPSYTRWVKLETDRRMTEKYPGYKSTREWAAQNAHRALHTDAVGNAIWSGLQGLAAKLGGKHGKSARMAIREAARSRVEGMSLLELRPGISERSEGRASAEVVEAWRKGDAQAAYDATRRQLFHHDMWRAIDEARDEVTDITAYFKSFKKEPVRRRIAKGGDEFLAAIEGILNKIEFGASPEKSADLSQLIASLRAQGLPVVLPSDFTGRDYETMSLADFRVIHKSVQNLEHLAREKVKEIDAANKESLAAKTAELSEHIGRNLPPPPPGVSTNQNPRGWEIIKNHLANGDWHLRKIEFLVRMLDGGQTAGLAHKRIFQRIADAETAEHGMFKSLLGRLKAEYRALSLKERFQHDLWVPFLDRDVNGQRVTNNIRRRDVLMIAANMRNKGNEERLLTSNGWSRADVLARLDEIMSDEDIEIINKMGRELEGLWPEISRVYKAQTGISPEKVTGDGVTLPSGRVIEGGYFPIIKDRRKLAARPSPSEVSDLWNDDFIPVAVEHGFTEQRGRDLATPLLLDLDALPHHMAKVIHYVTHYEATREVDRLTQNESVKRAIVAGLGMEAYNQIRPWLLSIAHDTDTGAEPLGVGSRVLRHLRAGSSIVLLNLKIATGTKQLLGFTVAAKELGATQRGAHNPFMAAKYLGYGTREFLRSLTSGRNPFAVINERSPAFELHRENYDRDVRLAYRSALSAFSTVGAARHYIVQMGMMTFNLFQGTVNAITWHGAHQKALDLGHERPDDYANSIVRMSQTGGGLKDLAAVQRGSEFKKSWTVMYSYRSVLYNQLAESLPGDMSIGMKIATRAAHFWYLALLPSMIVLAMRGGEGDSPEDEDYLKKLALETLITATSGIVGVDRLTEAAVRRQRPRTAPWIDAMYDAAVVVGKVAADENISDWEERQIINSIGMATHLPTGGLMNGAEFLSAYLDGRLEEPVADLFLRTPRQMR